MTMLGQHAFQQKLDVYQCTLARILAACNLPWEGLTLWKCNCNFHTHQYKRTADMQMDMFASFSAGEVCIANEIPLVSRVTWMGLEMDGQKDVIINDKFCIVDGVEWPAHLCNIGQLFSITDQGFVLTEKSLGVISSKSWTPCHLMKSTNSSF